MKTKIIFFSALMCAVLGVYLMPKNEPVEIISNKYESDKNRENTEENYGGRFDSGKENEEEIEAGREFETKYFTDWHYPYGNQFPIEKMNEMWGNVKRLPGENSSGDLPVNSWLSVGPYGMRAMRYGASTTFYSGRILDIDVHNGISTRVAAASGGLWGFVFIAPIPLSDNLNSLSIGSFDTKPGSDSVIFAGTGEPWGRGGTGLWKTTNMGLSWTYVTMNPVPWAFSKVRFDPANINKIHIAAESGYYQSTNGGSAFNKYTVGVTSGESIMDLAVNPANNNFVYVTKRDYGSGEGGVYRSTNGGINWTRLSNGIPVVNIGASTISICNSQPNILYANLSRDDNNSTIGIYKTTNSGDSWFPVYTSEFHGGQSFHACTIGVCPTNPNIVLAGGVALLRSSDGGSNWVSLTNQAPGYQIHDDMQCITWGSNGTSVWCGHDGGLSFSGDAGVNWSNSANKFPITQFTNIAVGKNNTNVMSGGTQDNGYVVTTNGGTLWDFTVRGDVGGAAIDPFDASKQYCVWGVTNGPLPFHRSKNSNYGAFGFWADIDNGIDQSCGQWYSQIKTDGINPVYLYAQNCGFVYRSTDYTNWAKLNTTSFTSDVTQIKVTASGYIYACLYSNNPSDKLKYWDGASWSERSSPLFPSDTRVRNIAIKPSSNTIAYALMNGVTGGSNGNKVFKTTNAGLSWSNITGDLPNIPISDLIPHPTDANRLYLGSELGCYRTTNNGTNWQRWNNGMPEAAIVTEMAYIDSSSVNKFYVIAGTYGRSMFMREISGDDPLTGNITQNNVPASYDLFQNFPNPFNPVTTIKFSMPAQNNVQLKIYDIMGREVETLINGNVQAGIHEIKFDGSNYSSGVYFYKITSSRFTDIKKMILVK
jgi:photosystem II stability/assembly factor-like uncharacterized protein